MRIHPPETIDEAFNLYAHTTKTYQEVSEALAVPKHTLKAWSVKYKWVTRKKELLQRMAEKSDRTSIQLQQEHRARVIKRDIEMSDRIYNGLDEQLTNMLEQFQENTKGKATLTPEDMENYAKITHLLARSAKTGSDISARAVALDNKKFGEGGDNDKGLTFNGPVQMNIAGEKIKPAPVASPAPEPEPVEVVEILDDFPMAV